MRKNEVSKEQTDLIIIIGEIVLVLFSLAVFTLLITVSLSSVYFDLYGGADLPRFCRENILLLILSLLLFFSVIMFLKKKTAFFDRSDGGHHMNRPFYISPMGKVSFFWALAVSMFMVFTIRGMAVEDAQTLDIAVNSFMSGDFSSLTEPGGYLFLYPCQLGYVAFGQLMYLLFGASNYAAYHVISALSAAGIILLLNLITWELFEDSGICNLMALMSFGMFFLFVFTTYIYSDLYSAVLEIAAIYLEIRYLKYNRTKTMLLSGILIGFAVMLKNSAYIALIAMAAILLFSPFINTGNGKERKKNIRKLIKNLLLALMLVAVVQGIHFAVNSLYSRAANIDSIPKGHPLSATVAMSIMDDTSSTIGWYNGYNAQIYIDSNYNYELTDKTCKTLIFQYLYKYARNPLHGIRFYLDKFLYQWADPTCISMRKMELASRHTVGQSELAISMIYGKGRMVLSWIMNVYQEIIYIGLAAYCILSIRKKRINLPQALIVLFIFGGMLFHEIWEANSRYSIPYYICMLPIAAAGIKRLIELPADCRKRLKV